MDKNLPQTAKVESERIFHGDVFVDSYEWLRDRESEEVLSYLRAENDYTARVTADQEPLRETIFQEIKSRVLETDLSVPTRVGDWWYFTRTIEGEQYPVYCRVAALTEGSVEERFTPPQVEPEQTLSGEEVLLDCNDFARDLDFFSLGSFQPSLSGELLTFGVDDSGSERYRQYFKDLTTGELLDDHLDNIFSGAYLTPDAAGLVYSLVDDSWRPYEVRLHTIGSTEADRVLFTEKDPALWLESSLSEDRSHLVLTSYSSEYTEVRLLALDALEEPARLVIDKKQRIQYGVEPITIGGESYLLIQHDHEALNSELVLAPYPAGESFEDYRTRWLPVMPHRSDVRIEGFALTADHLVVTARQDTTVKVFLTELNQLSSLLASESAAGLDFSEPAGFFEEIYTTSVMSTSIDSPVVRILYTSWVTPTQIFDYFPRSESLNLRRETPVLGGYNPGDYTAYRMWAPARDGEMIPLSIIHRADLDLETEHPLFQHGYGSYEVSMDPYFSVARLSLLDRGVIYAVAHIRGGGELGRDWYQQGKKLKKINTFTDFIDSTDFLSQRRWVDANRIVIEGGSAGGLLMGAVANMAPEKYRAVIAEVPFVDALTTILDPDLPLSALEWEEWGNPIEDQQVYQYMKSYSPYENIRPVTYPAIVAITSFNDTRVLYVEPAKWIAKLRETVTADTPVPLLKIEMDGGHGGGSGRYTRWKETAWSYAFALTHLLPDAPK
ncbi:S9 family peptidase [Rothia aerolata]|uniref:Oligopeptidase B n=1 Tax=Rothia aerolata TaxID=1812262 RepID=A0A917MVK6_9MICC|nr:S9 family peptidase [Rothia aerolata]GGH63259.1 oligopeptidase B [Rothia aerolata]